MAESRKTAISSAHETRPRMPVATMNRPGATEEVDFKSSSGYTALVLMFLSLVAIPFFIFSRMPPFVLVA